MNFDAANMLMGTSLKFVAHTSTHKGILTSWHRDRITQVERFENDVNSFWDEISHN